MQIYLVGGAVRDELLGLPVKDRDWVVTGATPADMLNQGYRQVGADFPVFLHPTTREEYALARTERKNGQGYHGFTVYSAPDVTLEDDLKRRDLTINAMAKAEDGTLIDPFQGREDLDHRLLRHVSEAFAEDPLRILRTARFAARLQPSGFRVADDTMALMQQMTGTGEVDHLVPERVWQELQRALHENEPGTFFEVLQQCGALESLIPELADEHARKNTLESALAALRCAHSRGLNTEARFAALLSPLSAKSPDAAFQRAKRLKATNDCIALARLEAATAPTLNADENIKPEAALELLDKADAWQRPERFATLLATLACTLPARAELNMERLEAALEAAHSVSARSLMTEGFSGKALGDAIRNERLQRIRESFQALS
jgi:tRNA nucleotidyltransferase (CCA-adding enzyme)